MTINTYTETAIQTCVFTALAEVPKNALMRRCCLIHLKNNSTCQRWRYRAPIVAAGKANRLVSNTMDSPVFGPRRRSRRSTVGDRTSVGSGKGVSDRVERGGRRNNKKKKKQ